MIGCVIIVKMKQCNTCHIEKTEDNFSVDNECSGGLKHRCKECTREYSRRHNQNHSTNHPVSVPPEGNQCRTCSQIKSANQFYRDPRSVSGVKGDCIECFKQKSREYGRSNRDVRREWMKLKMQHDPAYARKIRDANNAQKKKFKEKHAARMRLRRAVKSGRVVKLPCEVCGNPISQGHHDDYSKPLEVRWLCQTHHSIVHRKFQ